MNRSAIFAIALLFVAAAAIGGYFLARPNPLTARVAQLELDLQQAQQEVSHLKAEREKLLLAQKTPPPPPFIADSKKQEPSLQADGPKTAPLAPNAPATSAMPDLRKLLEAPGMKEMMRKQQEVQLDMTYGQLYQRLTLNEQERDNFKRLLLDRVAAQTDAGMKLMDRNVTPDQRKAIATEMEDQKTQSDANIRKFLNNDEDYQTFKHWEDTQPERMQLQLGDSSFASAGVPLTNDQREQLIETMAKVRKEPSDVPDMSNLKNMKPDSLGPDNVNRILEHLDASAARVQKEAAAFLSPQQVEVLKKTQEQMRSLSEAGMKMSSQMFGTGKK